MSRNMLYMSHVGYDTKLSTFYALLKVYSLLFALHKTITILAPILFISRRVVA